jgi:superoxide dismutase, Cu-Zn family
MKNYFIMTLFCVTLIGCKESVKENETNTKEPIEVVEKAVTATALISAKSNSAVSGTVTFTENEGKVSMLAKLSGLTPGIHAIHIHENGDCSAEDGSSAGGHWNPTNEDHGAWDHKMFHKGDIGNLEADENGIATLTKETDLWCINCEDETKNIIGKTIIVHKDADDMMSQPSGNAGDRIGCGEIVLEKE